MPASEATAGVRSSGGAVASMLCVASTDADPSASNDQKP